MAKLSSIVKNDKRRKLAEKFEPKRAILRKQVVNPDLSDDERWEAVVKLQKLPRNANRNRVRNRCILTGRSRGYYRKFRLSRIKFRELASQGMLPGITKASW